MQKMAFGLQMLVRVSAAIVIVLGILFWVGLADALIPVHIFFGSLIVIALWILAIMAARSGAPAGLVALAIVWGVIVPILGLAQERILPGGAHWIIQVVHLLVGIGAIGLAQVLGGRIMHQETHELGEKAVVKP
jgi:hypothetical protein